MSSTGSSEISALSQIRRFGLYRTIDARTEEFLKSSRKKQIRQGCACAAISTAITVTVVVSMILVYEYSINGRSSISKLDSFRPHWIGLLNDSTDIMLLDSKFTKRMNFDRSTLKLLPVLLRALNKNKYLEKLLDDSSTSTPTYETVLTTQFSLKNNMFSDKKYRMKFPFSKLYTTEYKSPSMVIKMPSTLTSRDYLRKRNINNYERVYNYLEKMMTEKIGYNHQSLKKYKDYFSNEQLPKDRISSLAENLGDRINRKSFTDHDAQPDSNIPIVLLKNVIPSIKGSSNCNCPKNMGQILNKLFHSFKKVLLNDFSERIATTPKYQARNTSNLKFSANRAHTSIPINIVPKMEHENTDALEEHTIQFVRPIINNKSTISTSVPPKLAKTNSSRVGNDKINIKNIDPGLQSQMQLPHMVHKILFTDKPGVKLQYKSEVTTMRIKKYKQNTEKYNTDTKEVKLKKQNWISNMANISLNIYDIDESNQLITHATITNVKSKKDDNNYDATTHFKEQDITTTVLSTPNNKHFNTYKSHEFKAVKKEVQIPYVENSKRYVFLDLVLKNATRNKTPFNTNSIVPIENNTLSPDDDNNNPKTKSIDSLIKITTQDIMPYKESGEVIKNKTATLLQLITQAIFPPNKHTKVKSSNNSALQAQKGASSSNIDTISILRLKTPIPNIQNTEINDSSVIPKFKFHPINRNAENLNLKSNSPLVLPKETSLISNKTGFEQVKTKSKMLNVNNNKVNIYNIDSELQYQPKEEISSPTNIKLNSDITDAKVELQMPTSNLEYNKTPYKTETNQPSHVTRYTPIPMTTYTLNKEAVLPMELKSKDNLIVLASEKYINTTIFHNITNISDTYNKTNTEKQTSKGVNAIITILNKNMNHSKSKTTWYAESFLNSVDNKQQAMHYKPKPRETLKIENSNLINKPGDNAILVKHNIGIDNKYNINLNPEKYDGNNIINLDLLSEIDIDKLFSEEEYLDDLNLKKNTITTELPWKYSKSELDYLDTWDVSREDEKYSRSMLPLIRPVHLEIQRNNEWNHDENIDNNGDDRFYENGYGL